MVNPKLLDFPPFTFTYQSLNTHSLHLHFQYILVNQNLFASHIICFNETIIQNICTYQKIHNAIPNNKFNISCYNDQHGIMILHNEMVSLSNTISMTNSNVKFIVTNL